MIGRHGRWTLFAAALLLLVQSSLSLAANAVPVARDIFGNVICEIGGGESSGGTGNHVPSCCVSGCTVPNHALPGSDETVVEQPADASLDAGDVPDFAVRVAFARAAAHGPRAPPPFD